MQTMSYRRIRKNIEQNEVKIINEIYI